MKEHISGDPDQWVEFRAIARGTRLYGVKSATADGADLWLFDPNLDSFVTASAKLKTNDHNKIEIVTMHPTRERPAGAGSAPEALKTSALIKAFSARAAHYAESDDFSGAVLLAKNGHVLFQNAYGFADREAHKPNQLNTQFRFGSMGKMFTAVAILQLVQDGKIDLSSRSDAISPTIPTRSRDQGDHPQLLTHTGGTGDIFGPAFTPTAKRCADSKTTSSCTASGDRISRRVRAGRTATTASSCSA